MPAFYMIFWSVVIILAIGLLGVRGWSQLVGLFAVTAVILFVSQTLFSHLSYSVGLHPTMGLSNPDYYLAQGPVGWLALLVMPWGWLGPLIGLHLVPKREESRSPGR